MFGQQGYLSWNVVVVYQLYYHRRKWTCVVKFEPILVNGVLSTKALLLKININLYACRTVALLLIKCYTFFISYLNQMLDFPILHFFLPRVHFCFFLNAISFWLMIIFLSQNQMLKFPFYIFFHQIFSSVNKIVA